MKKAWIVYSLSVLENKTNAFDWWVSEALRTGVQAEIRFFEYFQIVSGESNRLLYQWKETGLPDFIVVRGYNFSLTKYWEQMGIPVINTTESMMLSLNKISTHQVLTSHRIKTPVTLYDVASGYDYTGLCGLLDSDRFVVKTLEGSKGEGVYLVSNPEELNRAVSACGGKCLAQRYIATSHGRDIRLWVVGNRVAAGVVRYSDTSFKSNFSQGGKVASVEITEELETLSVLSARSLGLEFAGVDLLFDEDGYTVCEVNGNAGFRSLSAVSEVNIPGKLFEYIEEKFR